MVPPDADHTRRFAGRNCAKSDCLCVLAPSNPEVHERLSKLALASGKPVYVDKPFAQDFATAHRIVDWAAKHQTPLMSSSALRFSVELDAVAKLPGPVEFFATTGGGGNFPEYAIHQIEMIVTAMGTGIEAVTVQGKPERLAATLHYSDGRLATLAYSPFLSFTFHAQAKEQTVMNQACSKYCENMIEAMLKFFATRQTPGTFDADRRNRLRPRCPGARHDTTRKTHRRNKNKPVLNNEKTRTDTKIYRVVAFDGWNGTRIGGLVCFFLQTTESSSEVIQTPRGASEVKGGARQISRYPFGER